MQSYDLVIQTEVKTKPGRKAPAIVKTREFSAAWLGHVTANDLWEGGSTGGNTVRPVYMSFGGSEASLRPLIANFQTGKRAVWRSPQDALQIWQSGDTGRVELLKSAGYRYVWQRISGERPLAVVTAYLPELIKLDPGMIDPAGVGMISLTPSWWAEREAASLEHNAKVAVLSHMQKLGFASGGMPELSEGELLRLLPQAVYTVAGLERRITRPVIPTPAFMLQLFLAALSEGVFKVATRTKMGYRGPEQYGWHRSLRADDPWDACRASIGVGFTECGLSGMEPPVYCRTDHETLDRLLIEQVIRYQEVGGDYRAAPLRVPPEPEDLAA